MYDICLYKPHHSVFSHLEVGKHEGKKGLEASSLLRFVDGD